MTSTASRSPCAIARTAGKGLDQTLGDIHRQVPEHIGVAAQFVIVPAVDHRLGHRHVDDGVGALPEAVRLDLGEIDLDVGGTGVRLRPLDDRRCRRLFLPQRKKALGIKITGQ